MWWRRAPMLLLVVAGAAAPAAGCAHAPPQPVQRIEVSGTDAVQTIELRPQRGSPMDCGYECSVDVRPGRLYFLVNDKQNHRTFARLDVDGPSRVTVAPGDHQARVTGGTLFALGLAGVALGASTMIGAVFAPHLEQTCYQECRDGWDQWFTAGGITLAAGLVTGATGLVLWRRYGTAQVSEAPAVSPPASAARVRLTPAVGPRWTGLGLGGIF